MPAPPGPSVLQAFSRLPRFRSDPLGLFTEDARRWGDVVAYRFTPGLQRFFLISHPEHVQHVLQKNHRGYRRSAFYDMLRPLLGNGLVTNDGPSWLKQRRLMQPAFHRHRIAHLTAAMARRAEVLAERWSRLQPGEVVDVFEAMSRLTLDIAAETFFHTDVAQDAPRIAEALAVALHEFDLRTTEALHVPDWVPTGRNRGLHRAIRQLDDIVLGILHRRRRDPLRHDDLLSMLIEARDPETGEPMGERQLRDEVMTLLLAGHETTANLLTFTWLLLSQHPEHLARLRRELEEGIKDPSAPHPDELAGLPFMQQVLAESLRLYPPAWLVDRVALADDEIGGVPIPAGSVIALSAWVTHRRPDIWPDPERFDPERFSAERRHALHRFSTFPFGGGPHLCIGNHFALLEAMAALAVLAPRFDVVPTQPERVELNPSVTLRPARGLPARIIPTVPALHTLDLRSRGGVR